MRRLYEEASGEGKIEVVDEVLHSDFVCYDLNSEAGEVRGAEAVKGEIEYFRNAGLIMRCSSGTTNVFSGPVV